MSQTRYNIHQSAYPYFLTSSIVEGYPIFSNPTAAKVTLDALEFLQHERKVKLYAYVVMENHLHLIVRSTALSKHIRAFKSWTARSIINRFTQEGHTHLLSKLRRAKNSSHTDSSYQVWQKGINAKQLIGDSMMLQKIDYIHNNPVKRGFVDRPEEWRYSSARNYLGGEGVIPINLFKK